MPAGEQADSPLSAKTPPTHAFFRWPSPVKGEARWDTRQLIQSRRCKEGVRAPTRRCDPQMSVRRQTHSAQVARLPNNGDSAPNSLRITVTVTENDAPRLAATGGLAPSLFRARMPLLGQEEAFMARLARLVIPGLPSDRDHKRRDVDRSPSSTSPRGGPRPR